MAALRISRVTGHNRVVFAMAWPERIQRLIAPETLVRTTATELERIHVPMFGPYMPLRAAATRSPFDLEPAADATDGYATCDVGGALPTRSSLASMCQRQRCIANGGASYRVRRGVRLHEKRSYDVGTPGLLIASE
jgi:hypothetical protein